MKFNSRKMNAEKKLILCTNAKDCLKQMVYLNNNVRFLRKTNEMLFFTENK